MRNNFSNTQGGATLLEVILVLGIIGVVFVMGVNVYRSFQNTFQTQQVIYNVDQLFEAAANYYKANCAAGSISPNQPDFLSPYQAVSTGAVTYPPAADAYYPISIVSVLLANGYLQNWHPANPLVDPSGGESGYIVQLNPIVSTAPVPVNACVVITPGTPCLPITPANIASPGQAYSAAPTSTVPTTQAQVVTWVLQVAVKMKPQSKIAAYAALLGADCMSDNLTVQGNCPGGKPSKRPCPIKTVTTIVSPCSQASAKGSHNYLVWARIPTLATLKKNSVFSTSMQSLKQYNLMYTHDVNYEFNQGYSRTTSPAQAPVYYLCGG